MAQPSGLPEYEPLPDFVSPLQVPCFRDTMLHALGGGTIMGGWRFYKSSDMGWTRGRSAVAMNSGFKSFFVLALTSWGICRWRLVLQVRETMAQKQRIEEQQKRVRRRRLQEAI